MSNKKGPSNTLLDLNDFLFGQLERLDDPDLTPDELDLELSRTKAVVATARAISDNAAIILDAQKYVSQNGVINKDAGRVLQADNQACIEYGSKKEGGERE